MLFEKEIVRNKSLSPLQAELDYMEQQAKQIEESAGKFIFSAGFILFPTVGHRFLEDLFGLQLSMPISIAAMFVFLLLASFPIKMIGKRIALTIRARRPKLLAEVHEVIFEEGLFSEFAQELMAREHEAELAPETGVVPKLMRLFRPPTRSMQLLGRLKKKALNTLRKGEHSAYFDLARRPLGEIEIESAVLLAIVQELKRAPESADVTINPSESVVRLPSAAEH